MKCFYANNLCEMLFDQACFFKRLNVKKLDTHE